MGLPLGLNVLIRISQPKHRCIHHTRVRQLNLDAMCITSLNPKKRGLFRNVHEICVKKIKDMKDKSQILSLTSSLTMRGLAGLYSGTHKLWKWNIYVIKL